MFQQMNFLTKLTIGYAILLIVLGVGSYVLADTDDDDAADADTPAEIVDEAEDAAEDDEDSTSITALIPAFIGIPLLLAGLATTSPQFGRYGGIASTVLVALLLLGSLRGVALLFGALFGDDDVTYPMVLQTVLVLLSAGYLYLAFTHIRETMMNRDTAA